MYSDWGDGSVFGAIDPVAWIPERVSLLHPTPERRPPLQSSAWTALKIFVFMHPSRPSYAHIHRRSVYATEHVEIRRLSSQGPPCECAFDDSPFNTPSSPLPMPRPYASRMSDLAIRASSSFPSARRTTPAPISHASACLAGRRREDLLVAYGKEYTASGFEGGSRKTRSAMNAEPILPQRLSHNHAALRADASRPRQSVNPPRCTPSSFAPAAAHPTFIVSTYSLGESSADNASMMPRHQATTADAPRFPSCRRLSMPPNPYRTAVYAPATHFQHLQRPLTIPPFSTHSAWPLLNVVRLHAPSTGLDFYPSTMIARVTAFSSRNSPSPMGSG
ncbi:hypothetical protein C8F01DRAFT_1281168 [Mycena amicta]|nr:hypothetical protein C8F01DRAFT_1281168 [Mycena amicta]